MKTKRDESFEEIWTIRRQIAKNLIPIRRNRSHIISGSKNNSALKFSGNGNIWSLRVETALSRTPNVIVFDMIKAHNLKRVVMGEEVGTLVTG